MNKGIWLNEKQFVSFNEINQGKLTQEIATRAKSPEFFSSMFGYLPNPDPVLKRQGKDITVYEEIENDPKVSAVMEQRTTSVLDLSWEIDRGKSKSRESKTITQIFDDLDVQKNVEDIMETPFYGYTVLEIIWKNTGSYWVPEKLISRPREWFCFGNDNELRFKSKDHPYEGVPVSMDKFLLVQYKSSYKNPYGKPILSKCFWPVTFKRGGWKFWIIFVEKYGMPWIVGKQPRGLGGKAADDLLSVLQDMVQDAVSVIPDDSSVDIKEPGGKSVSADIYKSLRDAANEEIALAALSETLTTQMGDSGSYAASKTHGDRLDKIGGKDQWMTETVFNELIKKIYKFNFSSTSNRAKFIMYQEEDVDKDLAERDGVLTDKLGVQFNEDYISEEYGIDKNHFTIVPVNRNQQNNNQNPAPPPPAEFKDKEEEPDNFVDKVVDNIPDKLMQAQIEQVLKPVFELINNGADYSEIEYKLSSIYPNMKSTQLEQMLEKVFFYAEVIGRLEEQK